MARKVPKKQCAARAKLLNAYLNLVQCLFVVHVAVAAVVAYSMFNWLFILLRMQVWFQFSALILFAKKAQCIC